jgi:hypothetical protein
MCRLCLSIERVHWLFAKAQFEKWLEEQDRIHNEAQCSCIFKVYSSVGSLQTLRNDIRSSRFVITIRKERVAKKRCFRGSEKGFRVPQMDVCIWVLGV